jgi:hypothetical protein
MEQSIYINKEIYSRIYDILSSRYVILFDEEEEYLNIIRREIKAKNFDFLDGNLVLDEHNNLFKLIIT